MKKAKQQGYSVEILQQIESNVSFKLIFHQLFNDFIGCRAQARIAREEKEYNNRVYSRS